MIRYCVIGFLMLATSASFFEAKERINDYMIVPGERVGSINPQTREIDLRQNMPSSQPRRILYDEGEGIFHCGTEIFPGTEKSAILLWKDDKTPDENYETTEELQQKCDAFPPFKGVKGIVLQKSSVAWQTSEGLRTGLNLEQLMKLIGPSLSFSICPCDIGGNVLDRPIETVFIHVGYSTELRQKLTPYISSSDDGVFAKDVPSKLRSSIVVDEIVIHL